MTPKQVENARRPGKTAYETERRSKVKALWAAADAAAPKPGRVSDPGPLANPSLWCRRRRMWLRRESDPGLGAAAALPMRALKERDFLQYAPVLHARQVQLEPTPEPELPPPEVCAMGTWNEPYLAEQVEALQVQPCPGCLQHGAGVKLTGSTPRGIGSGTLDFRCTGCNAPRFLKRSRAQIGGGRVGVDLDENTERIAGAFDFAGISGTRRRWCFCRARTNRCRARQLGTLRWTVPRRRENLRC